MSDKPYWFPELCDEAYFKRLREDYPDKAEMSDEELHDYYNEGRKYAVTWDHVGDAYEEYENLADAFLGLVKASGEMLDTMANKGRLDDPAWAAPIRALRAALDVATGRKSKGPRNG